VKRHVALVGFMGAGKTTIGRTLGAVETDADVPIELFEQGEAAFRARETDVVEAALRRPPRLIDLGGGAVTTPRVRELLRQHAHVVWLDADVDTCWERVRGSDRPLAQDYEEFKRLYEQRRPLYAEVADVVAHDADDVALAAAGIHYEPGALQALRVDRPAALVTDANVAGIHGMDAQLALGAALAETHELPAGEAAKTILAIERLWQSLRLDRTGVVVALGGGCVTDAAGFAAATYLRGVDWIAVPTTLVGQVDAAIGGKTAIDLPQGKNLVGAFHWPVRTVIDPLLLETLPERERREGLAEVVKTSILAGENLHDPLDVRRCAAFKAAVCLRDPHDHGERKRLNLGHTFAHALEAAAGYEGVTHGQAVALGLQAALRLSGEDTSVVDEMLRPKSVRVDRERAWAAMRRDKKTVGGELRLVTVREWDVAFPEADVRAALDALIAD
jgi:shikimate kinase/3-dehydroquinate synthase